MKKKINVKAEKTLDLQSLIILRLVFCESIHAKYLKIKNIGIEYAAKFLDDYQENKYGFWYRWRSVTKFIFVLLKHRIRNQKIIKNRYPNSLFISCLLEKHIF